MGVGAAHRSDGDETSADAKMRRFHAYSERDETPLEEAVETEWSDVARAPIPITEERRRAIGLVRSGRVERRGVLRTFGRGFGFHRGCNRRGGIARRRGSRRRKSTAKAEFALEYWNCSLPEKIENVVEDDSKVCLVDFQQQSQLHPAIPMKSIVVIIDHHALLSNRDRDGKANFRRHSSMGVHVCDYRALVSDVQEIFTAENRRDVVVGDFIGHFEPKIADDDGVGSENGCNVSAMH